MSQVTKIQWCDASLSPWWGCTKVSPGCLNCYAEGLDARFHGGEHWGKGNTRKRIDSFEKNALTLDRKAKRLGKRLKVFPSMCDPFDPEVPVERLADFLDVMRRTPNLIWLVLTKRPGLFAERLDAVRTHFHRFKGGVSMEMAFFATFLDNMRKGWEGVVFAAPEVGRENYWIGTSVEDQKRADERIPQLRAIPAKVRFLSIEPMLGSIDLIRHCNHEAGPHSKLRPVPCADWVICGCESGANRRVMEPQWAMHLREQCEYASMPFFMKQMEVDGKVTGDIERFPTCLQVREFPEEAER